MRLATNSWLLRVRVARASPESDNCSSLLIDSSKTAYNQSQQGMQILNSYTYVHVPGSTFDARYL